MKLTPVLILLLALTGCMTEQPDPSVQDASIPLVSEHGVVLAESMDHLIDKIKSVGDLDQEQHIWVSSVEFLETDLQTVAFIQWMNEAGDLDGMALSLKNEGTPADGFEQRAENMKWRITCDGPCGCLEKGTINPDQTVTVECSCEDCTMDISQVE